MLNTDFRATVAKIVADNRAVLEALGDTQETPGDYRVSTMGPGEIAEVGMHLPTDAMGVPDGTREGAIPTPPAPASGDPDVAQSSQPNVSSLRKTDTFTSSN